MANDKYRQLSVADVGTEAWQAFERAKQAYRDYAELKEEAERLALAELPTLPPSRAWVFAYGFGKWSVFIGEPAVKAKPKAKSPGSLSAWMDRQQANGGRV